MAIPSNHIAKLAQHVRRRSGGGVVLLMLASACGSVSHEPTTTAATPEITAVPVWQVLLSGYELDAITDALDPSVPTMEHVELVPGGARVGWIQVPSILRLLGLKSGDVITHFDGGSANTESEWRDALTEPSGQGTLRVRRGETFFEVQYGLQLAPPAAPDHLLEQLRGCWRLPHAEVRFNQRSDRVWQWSVSGTRSTIGTTSTLSGHYNAETHSVWVPCTAELEGRDTCRIRFFHGDAHLMNDEATQDTRLQRCED